MNKLCNTFQRTSKRNVVVMSRFNEENHRAEGKEESGPTIEKV
jgi:hypothetical protein